MFHRQRLKKRPTTGRNLPCNTPFIRTLVRTLFALSCAVPAIAGVRAEWSGVSGPTRETRKQEFDLRISEDGQRLAIDTIAVLDEGLGSISVLDPMGLTVYQHNWGTRLSTDRAALPLETTGDYRVVVDLQNAVGRWRARVVSLPNDSDLRAVWISCLGLLVFPLAVLTVSIRSARGRWYWYGLGAALAVGASLGWMLGGIAFHFTVRAALEESLAHVRFLWIETAMLAVVSAVSWAVVAMVAAAAFPSFVGRRENALAAGVGAGFVEMIVVGAFSFLGASALFSGSQKGKEALVELGYDMAVTPLAVAVEPVRYALIATATAFGLAVIAHGIAARRAGGIVLGAALIGAIRMSGSLMRMLEIEGFASRLWLIAFAAPFAALAGLAYARRTVEWPQQQANGELPMETYLREYGEGRR